ncbi:Retinoblastoma-binding protein [Coemansia sp. RSA 1286]|nr:Retinoblastoma-binding protein [Coemansia sp. RSA 1286]
MSQIQYKFRSAKDYSSVVFDGLSITVLDLKQEIMREQKLDPEEFDLVITNEQTNEDYKDGMAMIPKNTMILVRRVPYTGPKMSRMVGAGHIQQQRPVGYGAGGGGAMQRGHGANASGQFMHRRPPGFNARPQRGNASVPDQDEHNVFGMTTDMSNDDDARIAAMLEQSNDQWQHQQSIMEMQRPAFQARPGYRPRPHQMRPELQGPPPPNYVCFSCGNKGHWIYNCPKNGQQNEGGGSVRGGGHRVKRTTGIPKSFLQKVENLDEVGNALVTSDGTLVVATANEAAWNSAQRLSRNVISNDDEIDPSIIPDQLKCNICHKLARDAVTTPCCKTVFCSSCIEKQLLEPGDAHFTCPACNTKDVVPDQLEVADEVRVKVDEFLREYTAKQAGNSNVGGGERSNTENADSNAVSSTVVPKPANVVRPPVQIQPRPRAYNFTPAMGMMPPGMMMGMGAGFAGMGAMQPMGGFMPPGMMMHQQRPGMVGPPLGMVAGQWNGNMTAPPPLPSAVSQAPVANGHSRARGESQSYSSRGNRSRSRSRSRSNSHSRASNRDRDRNRSSNRNRNRNRSKSPTQNTPMSAHSGSDLLDIGPEPNPEHPLTASTTNGEPMDTSGSRDHEPHSAASNGSGRRSERSSGRHRDDGDRRDDRNRSHREDSRSRRSERSREPRDERERERDRGRSHRRDDDRDHRRHRESSSSRHRDRNDSRSRNDGRGGSRRDGKDASDRRDRGRDRGNRSRSPARKERQQRAESGSRRSEPEGRSRIKEESRRGDTNSNRDGATSAGLSIRGQSAASASKTETGTRGSVMDRIRDDRPSAQQTSGSGRRRNRRR